MQIVASKLQKVSNNNWLLNQIGWVPKESVFLLNSSTQCFEAYNYFPVRFYIRTAKNMFHVNPMKKWVTNMFSCVTPAPALYLLFWNEIKSCWRWKREKRKRNADDIMRQKFEWVLEILFNDEQKSLGGHHCDELCKKREKKYILNLPRKKYLFSWNSRQI